MKKISRGKIAVTIIGLGIFAIATWFAARTPTPPPLPTAITSESSSSSSSGTTGGGGSDTMNASGTQTSTVAPVKIKARIPAIVITSPTSSATWTIGKRNNISWNRIGGVTGQIALVNATSGTVAGWIQQTIAPMQSSYLWDTQYIFINKSIPSTQKSVTPGRYVIKIYFASSKIPTVTSPAFSIVAPPQN